jgi:O-succinylbenzoate synthase
MRIDRISIYRVRLPLITPFRTAFGNDAAIESILVRLGSGGVSAWGESAPWENPAYSPESAAGAFLASRNFIAPLLLGKTIDTGDALQKELLCIKGNPFAKAAFDLAWWNLQAKQEGVPLWRKIGGTTQDVACGADIGVLDSIEDLLREIDLAMEAGYERLKLKYRPGWELDMLEAVRNRFPDIVIHVDCNSAYTLKDIAMLKKLDDFNLAMIEQPLMHDDILCHSILQKQIKTPICLDESISSPQKADEAIQMGACGFINIKPGRVGGLTNALAIHNLAQAAGIPCWVGGMLESSLGAHFCLALGTLPNIKYPSDIFPTSRFYARDLARPEMRHSAPSRFRAPDTIGAGAEPDAETMLEQAQELCHFAI